LVLLGSVACAPWHAPSLGTCFFVSQSGLALTSLHVVKDAGRIYVVDSTGRRSRAEILGRDERLDLATIQAHGNGVPDVLAVAVDDAVLGEPVVAIGVLLSGPRLASGSIVEPRALGRDFLLGTSAQVERGNSGGPLVNERGEVVGVLTKRRDAASGETTKLSFAVKSSSARKAFGGLPIGVHPAPLDRRRAIDRARRASCMIVAR
jgi:serine protease Do